MSLVHSALPDLHIMAACEVAQILWFKLLSLHIHHISFTSPQDFLAFVVPKNNKLGKFITPEQKLQIIATVIVILKCTWEAQCDDTFNHIPVDLH